MATIPPSIPTNTYVKTLVRVVQERVNTTGATVAIEGWGDNVNQLTPLCTGSVDRRNEIVYYARP